MSRRLSRRLSRPDPAGHGIDGVLGLMEHFSIATVAEQNPDFRRVLWTGKHTQLVIMTIPRAVRSARRSI